MSYETIVYKDLPPLQANNMLRSYLESSSFPLVDALISKRNPDLNQYGGIAITFCDCVKAGCGWDLLRKMIDGGAVIPVQECLVGWQGFQMKFDIVEYYKRRARDVKRLLLIARYKAKRSRFFRDAFPLDLLKIVVAYLYPPRRNFEKVVICRDMNISKKHFVFCRCHDATMRFCQDTNADHSKSLVFIGGEYAQIWGTTEYADLCMSVHERFDEFDDQKNSKLYKISWYVFIPDPKHITIPQLCLHERTLVAKNRKLSENPVTSGKRIVVVPFLSSQRIYYLEEIAVAKHPLKNGVYAKHTSKIYLHTGFSFRSPFGPGKVLGINESLNLVVAFHADNKKNPAEPNACVVISPACVPFEEI